MEKIRGYRYCTVPLCTSTSTNAPEKKYFRVPANKKMRYKWCKLMKKENLLSVKTTRYCCEDHFNVESDTANFMRWRLCGGSLRLKPGTVPTKFECQKTNKLHQGKGHKKLDISETVNTKESLSSIVDTIVISFDSVFTNYSQSAKSGDETGYPDLKTLNEQALSITLARIQRNPQLYIGIPKNCYHLIDIIHEKTEIPTAHILLCLKKVKLDTHFEELADQFGITADKASDIFTANIPILANILQSFIDSQDFQTIPHRQETFVIDSLEINVEPSDESRELTQTERGNTVKYVICCTPDGYINYVSPGYGGKQSDERLLKDTNYLDRLRSGDSVIPNGLTNVESMLLQKGLKVIKPRARKKDTATTEASPNSTPEENQLSDDQLKRLVQRVREFTMVKDQSALSPELVRVLDETMLIACALINLQSFVIN